MVALQESDWAIVSPMLFQGVQRDTFPVRTSDHRGGLLAFIIIGQSVAGQREQRSKRATTNVVKPSRPFAFNNFRKLRYEKACLVALLESEPRDQSVESLGKVPADAHTSSAAERRQYEEDLERLRALDPETCRTCQNEGVVTCTACNGSGVRTADPDEVYRFFCPVCLGQKQIRCPDCTGRCLAC
jgi:hypothetical protein